MFYINDAYVEEKAAKISILDLGLVRGYGVFDYLRTYNGRPFHLYDHLQRLKFSAEYIGLSLPKSLEEIEEIVTEILGKDKGEEQSLKIMITGGTSSDQFLPQEKSTLIVFSYPFQPFPPNFYKNGIKTVTTSLSRTVPQSKTLHYIPAIMTLQKKDAQEALYLNKNKEILEATTSNFFAFKNGVLITPDSAELLHGITREVVLKLAKGRFPVELRPIHYEEIKEFDEAFLTSSTKEVLPVSQIDETLIPLGNNTQVLSTLFADYVKERLWEPLNISRYSQSFF